MKKKVCDSRSPLGYGGYRRCELPSGHADGSCRNGNVSWCNPYHTERLNLCLGDSLNHCGWWTTALWCEECWIDYCEDPEAYK